MASQLRLWSEQELQAQIGYKQQAFTSAGNPPDCGRSRLQSRPLPIVYLHAVWGSSTRTSQNHTPVPYDGCESQQRAGVEDCY